MEFQPNMLKTYSQASWVWSGWLTFSSAIFLSLSSGGVQEINFRRVFEYTGSFMLHANTFRILKVSLALLCVKSSNTFIFYCIYWTATFVLNVKSGQILKFWLNFPIKPKVLEKKKTPFWKSRGVRIETKHPDDAETE